MSGPIAFWRAEHASFSRLLNLLDRQLAAFHAGEQPNYALMLDIVEYMRHFPDRAHHPREDVAFARLADKAPDLCSVVGRLRQEHRVIATAGAELQRRLADVLADAFVARATVEAAAATYLTYYRNHIATEEREVLPRAEELLSAEDWSAVEAAVQTRSDPLSGDDVDVRYRELRRQIAFESADR